MINKDLETKLKAQNIRVCACCGNEYDLQRRRKEVKNYVKPNTAKEYCSDKCWAIETSIRES